MKSIFLVAVLGIAQASYICLSCKYSDTNAGFLYSYGYCNDDSNEVCQSDSWNLMNKNLNCLGDFKPGYSLDIDEDCNAEEVIGNCPSYQSDELTQGVYMNYTKVLDSNEKCTFLIDATKKVARVIFDDVTKLGVLYPGYVIGEPITVKQGLKKYITIYNGNDLGAISFKLSFSGASRIVSGMVAIAAVVLIY